MGHCGSLLFIRNRFLTFVEYIFLTADSHESLIIQNYENDLFIYLYCGTLDEFFVRLRKRVSGRGKQTSGTSFWMRELLRSRNLLVTRPMGTRRIIQSR